MAQGFNAWVAKLTGEVALLNVTQDIQPALLHMIDKMDQGTTRPWVSHKKQHLWSPELDMVLPWVEEEQILSHLVEDESLADVAPVLLLGRRREMKKNDESDADGH